MKQAFALLLLVCSNMALAASCLSELNDIDAIMKHKEDGTYRDALPAPHAPAKLRHNLPFAQYIKQSKQWIEARNPRASWPCPLSTHTIRLLQQQGGIPEQPRVADLLSPFELKVQGSNKVALLFHGLTDSPFTYQNLAAFFYDQGYNVRTVLLPGHGTAPSELQEVEFEQWQALADYAIARTSQDYQEVIIGGYSTGAALAIDALSRKTAPANVNALMLWSPASEPHNKNGWMAKWVDVIPFVNWIDKDADIDFAKYESFPFAAAALAHEAMSAIEPEALEKRQLPDIPLFMVQSDVDTTIDAKASLRLFDAWHEPQKRPKTSADKLIYYGQSHHVAVNREHSEFAIFYECRTNKVLCDDVIDISHIAIVNSPENPYYGRKAVYRNCGSYLEDDSAYRLCKTGKTRIGERTAVNLSHAEPLQRLTYNPFFTLLKNDMSAFLERCCTSALMP